VVRSSTDASAVGDPLVTKALRFMSDNSDRPMKVEEIVAQVPTSYRSLERRFQKVQGRSIISEMIRMRIERAKRLLSDTHMSVKKVALSCGFSSSQDFYPVFRRCEGVSPGTYRRRAAGDTPPARSPRRAETPGRSVVN